MINYLEKMRVEGYNRAYTGIKICKVLLRVSSNIYIFSYCYWCHLTIMYCAILSISWIIFEYLPVSPLHVCSVSLTRIDYFKDLWPCYLHYPLVNVKDNFWRVREIIDGFNNLCWKITSGAEKTAYESMSSIRSHTTPKWYLPHYLLIFRNPELFGT